MSGFGSFPINISFGFKSARGQECLCVLFAHLVSRMQNLYKFSLHPCIVELPKTIVCFFLFSTRKEVQMERLPLGEPRTCDGLLSQVLRGYQRQAGGKLLKRKHHRKEKR
mgnify:CR=1 FL=1